MKFRTSAIAWLAVAGLAFGGTGSGTGSGGGGTSGGSGTSGCVYDVKHDLGSSECKRDGACGGGGSVSLPGGTVVKGNGSVPCCFTENVIPPHDHLVPGKLKILHDEEVRGYTVFRKCVAPFTFLFFDIGKWSCEMEQIVYVGTYHVYTLGPCDDSGKSDSAPGD